MKILELEFPLRINKVVTIINVCLHTLYPRADLSLFSL